MTILMSIIRIFVSILVLYYMQSVAGIAIPIRPLSSLSGMPQHHSQSIGMDSPLLEQETDIEKEAGLFYPIRFNMISKQSILDAWAHLLLVSQRVPHAVSSSGSATSYHFIQSAVVLVPVGLVFKISLLPVDYKLWFKSGAKVGVNWSIMSATLLGGELLSAKLRNKEDRWNRYIGSGISSALGRIREGPLPVMQGFATGFAFMYAVDRLCAEVPLSLPPLVTPSAASRTRAMARLKSPKRPPMPRRLRK